MLVHDGIVHGQRATGTPAPLILSSHEHIATKGRRSQEKVRQAFTQFLALGRLKQGWELALVIRSKDIWLRCPLT